LLGDYIALGLRPALTIYDLRSEARRQGATFLAGNAIRLQRIARCAPKKGIAQMA